MFDMFGNITSFVSLSLMDMRAPVQNPMSICADMVVPSNVPMLMSLVATVPFTQDRFLTNDENKTGFIRLLKEKLKKDGQTVKICKGDADKVIVSTTLEQAEMNYQSVVTVADDTDVAMMLLYHWQERHGEVIFFQEKENKRWKMNDLCRECDSFREHILLVHAFTGCDTTSAPFGKGRSSFLTLLKKNEAMQMVSDTMNDVWTGQEEVGTTAIKAFQIIYGGKNNETLCKLR